MSPHGKALRRTILTATLTLALAGLAAPPPALAGAETYAIDPHHTQVAFKIRHFFSKVQGRFNTFEGTIVLDRADLAKGSVSFSIDAASIDTNAPDRDNHLRSADFFDVEKSPKITFKSTRVKQVAKDKLQVEGNLTIRGVTRPVTLDVDVLGFGPGAGFRGGFEARTTINRADYGVSWNKALEGGGTVLGNDVEIAINVEAVRQDPKPASGESSSS
jgi:polyisoprenoid-binding protein YceI